MKAYHNDPTIKKKYLARVRAHKAADEIIKGQYWSEGKGCAVGCTIHSGDHKQYEVELGIPQWLARCEDTIFEGLPNARAKLWPSQFLSAIKPGADLEQIKVPFMVFILKQNFKYFNVKKFPEVEKAIKEVIELYESGNYKIASAAESAESAAWPADAAAWSAAESAAESAAWSAARSAARSAAWSAAESAAWSAESAARSAAESAARSAAWSAAWPAAESAKKKAYVKYADHLLKLLKGCSK